MAVITKTNVLKLTELIGDSYQTVLDAYGNYGAIDSVVNTIGRAKVFVRGGSEAPNGVREVDEGTGGSTLDLIPTASGKVVTIRRGDFYLDGEVQSLKSSRAYDFSKTGLLASAWWYGAGYDSSDFATLQPLAKLAQRAKALIYASNEVITVATHPGATNMVSGEVFANTSASFLLNGTIDDLASPFAAPTSNTYLDKVQLYISTNMTGASPNTGLKVYIAANSTDKPDMTSIIGTSLKVNEVNTDGGWIDFIFDNAVLLTGTSTYWVVLAADTPDDGSASNLSSLVYYQWNIDTATSANTAHTLRYSSDNGTSWTGSQDYMAACRFIEYLKVVYTPVLATASSEGATPVASGIPTNLSALSPTVSHAKVALCDLFSPAANPASGATVAGFGNDYTTTSVLSDVRTVVGFSGLEDDDQMSVIFPAINTTENKILIVANEASTSSAAGDFAAVCSGLAAHVIATVGGTTFKNYWKANDTYFSRSFRKVWKFNQKEELVARFGTFTNNAAGPVAFPDPRWVSDNTLTADSSVGANLEIHIPSDAPGINSTTDVYVFGITTVSTLLNARAATGAAVLSVDDPTIFAPSATPAKTYLWVQKDGATNGELLKVTSINGNELTLVAETGFVGGTTVYTHEAGDRVWLVDKMLKTLTTTVGVAGASIALTSNFTGIKFVGCADAQPKSSGTNPGSNGDVFVVQSS